MDPLNHYSNCTTSGSGGGVEIDDGTISTITTWSSSKIDTEIGDEIDLIIDDGITNTTSTWSSDYINSKFDALDTAIELTAGENIPNFTIVYIENNLLQVANNTVIADYDKQFVFAKDAISIASSGAVTTNGIITNPLWSFNANDPVYLSGVSLTTTKPIAGYVLKVGYALTTTSLLLDIDMFGIEEII